MPRRKALKVVGYPIFAAGKAHPVRVKAIKEDDKSHTLVATLEHLHREQEGRLQNVVLFLPVRPSNKTASFFRACNMDVNVNSRIVWEDTVGKVLKVFLEPSHDSGADWQIVSFEPLTEEANDDADSE